MRVIQGDVVKVIGDNLPVWKRTFSTGGRDYRGDAIIMLMVKGLTETPSDVAVYVNDEQIGVIERYQGADPAHWFTQIMNIGYGVLHDGENVIEIRAVGSDEPSAGNLYDDFRIKDVVCFFQQSF